MVNPLIPPPGNPRAQVNRSTIIPLLGDRSALAAKTHVIPVFATIIAGAALGAAYSDQLQFIRLLGDDTYNRAYQVLWILGGYITFMASYYIYRLCGRDKPWWLMAGVFIVVALLTWRNGPLGQLAAQYNHLVLPDVEAATPIWRIFGAFFGPGLGEEFVKALPIFALAALPILWKDPLARRIGVIEPLDGILVGVASAAAFALTETIGDYIWLVFEHVEHAWRLAGVDQCKSQGFVDQQGSVTQETLQACLAKFPQIKAMVLEGAAGNASFRGLTMMLFRGLPAVSGHLAYSGVFGYFIGLAVMRPAAAPRILIVGWLTAAALHGSWDAVQFSADSLGPVLTSIISVLLALFIYAYLASVILKARKISPTRSQNFATVALLPAVAPQPAASPVQPRPQQASPRAAAPAAPLMGGKVSPAAAAAPAPSPAPSALVLKMGPVTRAVAAGLSIEPMHLGRAGAGRGKAPIAEFAVNPSEPGVLGLRNLSDRVYRAKLPTGKTIDVSRGEVVRLAPGVVIDFGGIEGIVQAK